MEVKNPYRSVRALTQTLKPNFLQFVYVPTKVVP
jgi:hypothetical protein